RPLQVPPRRPLPRRAAEDGHRQAAALPRQNAHDRPADGLRPGAGDDRRGTMTEHHLDILIVGAGPVGLYGVYYAGVRGLKVGVIDSLSEVGGQVSALYPEKLIFDIAGYPMVKGRDLITSLAAQAAQADPVYLLGQEAQELTEHGDGAFTVTTSTGDVVHCGAIVLTAGIGTFTPRKLPAGEDFLGRGLEYFVPDPVPYAGSEVVIVGGGDSALDWALMLEEHAKSVTVVHRRKVFRAHAATVAQ